MVSALASVKCIMTSVSNRKTKMTREATIQILDMVEQGILDKDAVIKACLNYLSEDEVQDMAEANEFLPTDWDFDEDEPLDTDGDPLKGHRC